MAKKINDALLSGDQCTCNLTLLDDGTVVIRFTEKVSEMVFTPAQAKQIGVGFIEMGTRGEMVQFQKTAVAGPRKVQ